MPQAQNISQQTGFPEWINFDFLRRKGLEHIGTLSGDWWSDHNTHDPGITILEVLCYALTDLGYRTQFDAKNIFARPYNELDVDSNFFTPDEILTCNPLTLVDFKKLLLDIKGVRNAWLVPVVDCNDFQGLYNVFIDIDDFIENGNIIKNSSYSKLILNEVKKVLYAHRSLGEDFKEIKIVGQEKLKICLNLDLTASAIPEEIIVEAFLAIQNFLTPYIPFYTLQELLTKGKKIEEIFSGRPSSLLSHGFIDNEDLALLEPKSKLHISDLYNILMKIEGIRAVTQLTVNNEAWCLALSNEKSPSLDIDCFNVNIAKGEQLPIQKNKIDWINIKQKIRNRLSNYNKILRNKYELGKELVVEENLDLADYTSIMEEFPVAYGVGSGHTPLSDENTKMKHHAFQMKGYLAFFDQLLVNYLGQLANLRSFFKLYDTDVSKNVQQSYAIQSLVDKMPMAEDILKNAKNVDLFSLQLPVVKLETKVSTRSERDRIMELFRNGFDEDRLEFQIIDVWEKNSKVEDCFRFYFKVNIKGTDYKLVSFNANCSVGHNPGSGIYESIEIASKEIDKLKFYGIFEQAYTPVDENYDPNVEPSYGFTINEKSLSYEDFLYQINEKQSQTFQRREEVLNHLLARFSEQFTEYSLLMYALNGKKRDDMEMIKDKERFLLNYPDTSRNRGKGFDYSDKSNLWNTFNTSGFEKRVAGYMGIDDWKRRNLNLFKTVKNSVGNYQQWTDEFNNIILTTSNFFDKNLLTECVQKICTKGIIEDIDCYNEGYYTFEVVDECGNVLANHPQRYDSKERRDEMKSYFGQMIIDKIQPSSIEYSYTYKYKLCNEKGEDLVTSSIDFESEDDAKRAFYQLLAYAVFEKNYEINTKGKKYFFCIKDSKGQVIAISKEYATAAERDVYKSNTIKYLEKYWLPFQIKQLPKSCTWQMQDIQGKPFVKGVYHFADCDSSASAYSESMNLASNAQNWDVVEVENKWHLGLWRIDEKSKLFLDWMPKERRLLAISVLDYFSVGAANDALQTLRQDLVNNNVFLPILFKNKKTKEYGYEWYVPQLSRVIMRSKQLLKTEQKAIRAYDISLKLLTDASNYHIAKGKDDLYKIEVFDYDNNVWLISEDEFTQESEALKAVLNYVDIARTSSVDRDILTQIEGEFLVKIIDSGTEETVIESAQYFKEIEEAYQMTVTISDLISDKNNFKYTEEVLSNGATNYGFELIDKEKQIIAIHPQQYGNKEKVKDVLGCLSAFESGLTPKIEETKHEKTLYLNHDCYLQLIYKDVSEKQDMTTSTLEKSLPEKDELLYDIEKPKECEGEKGCGAEKKCEAEKVSENTSVKEPKNCRMRMLDALDLKATFSKQFLTDEELLLEKNAFVSYWKSADKIFPEVIDIQSVRTYGTDLSTGPSNFCTPPKSNKSANYHAFQFSVKHKNNLDFTCTKELTEPVGKIALRTINVFDTSDEAMTYGNENLIHFISLLKDYDTYTILKCPNKSRCFFLQVFDYMHEKEYPALVSEHPFETEKCARIAMKYLIEWANRYPVIKFDNKDKKEYKYQILLDGSELSNLRKDSDSSDRFWTSNHTYDSWGKAYDDFLECLRLLNYTPNIFHLNKPFALAIGEILLETNEMLKETIWPELVWRLEGLNKGKHLHIMPTDDCACEIVLSSDCFKLAFHPYAYDNPIQRTRAWQQWYSTVYCEKFKNPNVLVAKKNSNKNKNFHQIKINGHEVIQYESIEDNDELSIYRILKYAEFPEFYEIISHSYKDNNSVKTIYRMTLCDEDHQQIAVFLKDNDDCFQTYDECEMLQKQFILMAREHPFKLGVDGKYYFRIYDRNWKPIIGAKPSVWDLPNNQVKDIKKMHCKDSNEIISIDGQYVWQSSIRCYDPEEIKKRFEKFIKTLKNIKNYKFTKDNLCGYFSIQVVDTDEIWAYYPMNIKSSQKTAEIEDKIWANINREGFHVIEHILLRDDETRDACCDKISGIVSIIIPHWSQRFQNEQFRAFLQSTIGRELPAHLAPQIFWVSPEGMMKFEKAYYKWLYDDGKKDSLELKKIVGELVGYAPLSTLETKNANNILLDETILN